MHDLLINENMLPEKTPALLIDSVQLKTLLVSVRDLHNCGCTILCDRLDEFSDEIMLHVKGIEELYLIQIPSNQSGSVLVKFQGKESEGEEARLERRVNIFIPAVISNRDGSHASSGKIYEASHSGCRIEASTLNLLQDDIVIKVEALKDPIKARIMWHKDNYAGVKLLWNEVNEPALQSLTG